MQASMKNKGVVWKEMGEITTWQDTWNETLGSYLFISIHILQTLAPSKGLIHFRYHFRNEELEYFKT